ncbi:MAG: hypothetical protein H0X33_12430 [Taibaiella sp.]|nr:hypothetical protein [Taibaiella sp.]
MKLIFMDTTGIRQKLHQFIDTIEDAKAAAIYTLFENEMDTDYQRKKLVQEEREKYLKGAGRSYSPDEVKLMALDKQNRNGL